jgi:hypothetical protein
MDFAGFFDISFYIFHNFKNFQETKYSDLKPLHNVERQTSIRARGAIFQMFKKVGPR